MMNRREWLASTLGLLAASRNARFDEGARIETVTGPRRVADLGLVLPHEHVLVDFIGAEAATPDRYDVDEVVRAALPHLRRIREQGVSTVFECTPAYLGRDPRLLRRLVEESGVALVTNTGYYAANGGKHLPAHARVESADELAARWIAEARDGIDGTGIKPGFIKIGVDGGLLDAIGRTLIQAAARTHRATGLTIAAHTGDGRAAMDQLDVLTEEGVDPSAWIWVHAQNEKDAALHRRAAERGAWVEFDGLAPESVEEHVARVGQLRKLDLLSRVLVSHDAGWYHVGEPGGGSYRGYDTLMEAFLPALRESGYSAEEVTRLTRANPARAFTPARRLRERR
jgi:phosphotriesterase-related protein